MDEPNIYADLDHFMLEQQIEQVQENNKELLQIIEKLEETTKKFQEEISHLKKINHHLERNISALFKTAKSEIERKDKNIAELRRDLDNLKFKRGNKKSIVHNEDLQKELDKSKCVIEQKNRIIQSLTKELENAKKEISNQDKNLKRNASHFEDDDLRNRLGKKRKLDDKHDCKRDKTRRPRSRSKSKIRDIRFDSRLKSRFDKKRTIRRNRSGSFEQRRSSIIEKHRSKYENSKYSKSRSRSPASHKSRNNTYSEKNSRTIPQYQEKINKHRSRSRSLSNDRKKYHKHSEKSEIFTNSFDKNFKCEKKAVHNNLFIEDSGMSSSNSHTPELLLKCDEIKSNLLEGLKDEDLEEGEIDCSLEDINSDEDNFTCKEKVTSVKKENIRNIKLDKREIKKPCELSERPKKVLQNKNELFENIIKSDVEIKVPEIMETKTNADILPESESKRMMDKENSEIKDDFKNSHDVLELMVQSNFLDDLDLDIDEEIIKMKMLDEDKRKKRKEDKARISKLRNAISECKQNIELLEHNFCSDDESETEDEFNKTGSCVEESAANNTKHNNLVLKISKGTIVKSNVEPKSVNLKDEVPDKNTLSSDNKPEIVDKIQNDILDESALNVNKQEKHIEKVEEIADKNVVDTDKKLSVKEVIKKSSESKCTDGNKSSEDDKRKKPKDVNVKIKAEKMNETKSVEDNSTEDKTETCSQEKDALQSTKTDSLDFKGDKFGQITEKELLEAINNIVEDVKVDENKYEQNFANITSAQSVVPEAKTKNPAGDGDGDVVASKLNETQVNKDETTAVTKDKQPEPERRAPLKARRRRAFICIT